MISETRLAARYLLVSEIAEGPKALVWRALDERLDRTVAVKILRPRAAADPQVRPRFVLGTLAAARLSHSNIVRVFDTGEQEGIPFVVMELMPGGSLASMLERGLLAPGHAAVVGEAVAAALVHSHDLGVAHRNLKPSNILLSAQGLTKVSDFETAEALPEDRRADVVALGVLLYEALTGRPPEAGRGGRVPRPSDFRPEIPRALDAAVMRAIAPDKGRAFSEPREIGRALAELAAADEIPAPGRSAAALPASSAGSSFVRTEGRWLLRTALLVALAAGVAIAALNLGRNSPLTDLFGRKESQPQELRVAAAATYDPPPGGNGEENAKLASKTTDGDPATVWHSESYRTADLGGAKPGVGLTFDLGSPRKVDRIDVISVEGGWAGSIRESDDGSTWSDPLPSIKFDRAQRLDAQGTHRYWMIWITELVKTPGQGRPGLPYSVGITEVQVWGK